MSPPQGKPRGSRPPARSTQRPGRPPRRRPLDPARQAGVRCAAGCDRAGRLPQLAAASPVAGTQDQRTRRRLRHRADLRQLPRSRSARRDHRCGRRPVTGRDQPGAARSASARDVSTAAHPRRCARRRLHHRQQPESNFDSAVRASSTACCARSVPVTSNPGSTSSHPTGRPIRSGTPPSSMPTARWIAQAFVDALGADAGELDAALASDDQRPRCTWRLGRGAHRRGVGRCGRGHGWPVFPVRGVPVGRRTPHIGRGARRPGLGPGRGQPIGGARPHLGAGGRRRRAMAGPVRRAGRQDRAAGRAGRWIGGPSHGGGVGAAPRRPGREKHPGPARRRSCGPTDATPV